MTLPLSMLRHDEVRRFDLIEFGVTAKARRTCAGNGDGGSMGTLHKYLENYARITRSFTNGAVLCGNDV